ncbi:MAG: RsmG family class I SAM-dependent methyltransferase [Balneolales bacterium]
MSVISSNVSRETFDETHDIYSSYKNIFISLIDKWLMWNRSINIMSRRTSRSDLENHIIHSLLLLNLDNASTYDMVLDAGSGGGLPGIPLAIVDPGMHYLLVEKVYKKQLVLKDIIRSLGISNAEAVVSKVRDISLDQNIRVVSKHAFHINNLIDELKSCNWSEINMLKGDDIFDEIKNLSYSEIISHIEIKSISIDHSNFFQNKYILTIKRKIEPDTS